MRIMKNLPIVIIFLFIQSFGSSQVLTDMDEVSTLTENLIAIKNENQWGFINEKGLLVVNFRNDFVLDDKQISYPLFKNKRCLIRRLVGGKYLYGYIDTEGNEVIKPQYLNASKFNNGFAIIIKVFTETIGYNEVLKKDVISSKLEEYIINTNGEIVKYLENPRNYIPSKAISEIPPKLHSKFIAPHLIAVMKKDEKWDIYEF